MLTVLGNTLPFNGGLKEKKDQHNEKVCVREENENTKIVEYQLVSSSLCRFCYAPNEMVGESKSAEYT